MTEKKTRAKYEKVDWDAMEADWRAGIKPKLHMEREYGVSRAAMNKHWGDLGIERDLTAKIKAEAEAKVTQDAVTSKVTPVTKIPEREVIEANAEALATVIRGQRKAIFDLWELAKALMAELKATTENLELFEQVGELCLTSDKDGIDKLNELYRKVMSLPQRTDTMKKLTEVIKMIIELERKVFKLDDGADPVEAAARGAAQGAASAVASLQMDFSDVKDQFK